LLFVLTNVTRTTKYIDGEKINIHKYIFGVDD
jgi:hypothetical protein